MLVSELRPYVELGLHTPFGALGSLVALPRNVPSAATTRAPPHELVTGGLVTGGVAGAVGAQNSTGPHPRRVVFVIAAQHPLTQSAPVVHAAEQIANCVSLSMTHVESAQHGTVSHEAALGAHCATGEGADVDGTPASLAGTGVIVGSVPPQ
jgi:hypothetical protein